VSSKESPASFNWRAWLPFFVFVVALLVRLMGIGWGLPNELHAYSYHPDEPVIFGASQQIEPTKLDFDPGFYNYGTLYLSMLRIASDVVGGYGAGFDPEKPETYFTYMAASHMAGRVMNSFAGAGMAVVVFLMLRRRLGNLGGLAAAAVIAFAPALVVHSRFQTVDIMAVFFLTLSAYFALKLLPDWPDEAPAMKVAVLSGLFAGLSASTKFTGVLALLTLYTALLLARDKEWLKLSAAGTGVALFAFLITTPGALLNTSKFLEDFRFEMVHVGTGHGLVFAGTSSGFLYHLNNMTVGMGALVLLLGLAGLVFAGVLKRHWALALLAFFVPYYFLIGRAEVKFIRYTFPLYIGVAAGFGWAVAASHRRPGLARGVAALGILALGGETQLAMLRGVATNTAWMSGPDVRDQAAQLLKGQDVAVGLVEDPWFYTPPFYPLASAPLAVKIEQRLAWMDEAKGPRVVMVRGADGGRAQWDPRLVTEVRPEYIVISSFEFEDRRRLAAMVNPPSKFAAYAEQYRAFWPVLEEGYNRSASLGNAEGVLPHDLEYIRPTVEIWKRKDLP
jgi:hypothetical protein